MFLTEISLSDAVKRQYSFKLRAFLSVFSSLLGVQLIGILFSLGGVRTLGTGTSSGTSIKVSYYSADIVIVFTMIWILITGILITTKAVRYDDFTFVGNRLSSNLANILFLLTASIVGGVSAVLAGFTLKTLVYFSGDIQYGTGNSLFEAPAEFFLSAGVAILYMLLFASGGYLTGMLAQFHKIFVFLLPSVIIGFLVYTGIRNEEAAKSIFKFIFYESSLFLFSLKILILSALFFAAAVFLSDRMEVRK